jgi:hypothetical protein
MRLEVKHISSSRLIFLIRTKGTSEQGDNPLFIFDGKKLWRIREHAELYDVAVDKRGQRIAYCYWSGNRRHVVVNELN